MRVRGVGMRVRSCGSGDASCVVLKFRRVRVLLDCGVDLGAAWGFAAGISGESGATSWHSAGVAGGLGQRQYAFLDDRVHIWTPLLGAADLEGLDAVLLGSPLAILGLPFLTERQGYRGAIFAPAVAIQVAKVWMAELVAYGEGDCLEAVGRGERRASWLADEMSALPMCLRGALCAGQLDGGAAETGVHEALEPALAALCWREAYTSDEVAACLARLTPVNYGQSVALAGGSLHATAHASGECIGGAAWVLSDGTTNVGYLGAALPRGATTLATPMATAELQGLDALIVGHRLRCGPTSPAPRGGADVTPVKSTAGVLPLGTPAAAASAQQQQQQQPSSSARESLTGPSPAAALSSTADPASGCGVDAVMAEVVRTVGSRGCVLLPVDCAGDAPLILINKIQHALQEAKLGHTPTIYWISPAAAPLLATATCSVEWLGEKQQRRVFQPKPPFPHEEMMKKGQLVVGAALSTPHIQAQWREPCIALVSPLSWHNGPGQQLMQRWRGDARHAVIFTRPGDNAQRCVAPYDDGRLAMRAFKVPLVPLHKLSDAAALFSCLRPRQLLVPESLRRAVTAVPPGQRSGPLASEEVVGFHILEDAKLSFPRLSEMTLMKPELALQLEPTPVPGNPGVSAARCSAWLSLRDGRWELSPMVPRDEKDEGEGSKRGGERHVPEAKCMWGRLSVEGVLKALQREGLCGVQRTESQQEARKRRRSNDDGGGGGEATAVVAVVEAGGYIELAPNRVHVSAATVPMRARLLEVITSQLHRVS